MFYVNKFWQGFSRKSKSNPVNIVAQRFLQAYLDHGVQPSQIPRLIPEVKLDDLKSEESLLAALTPEILDRTANLFSIRSAWLEGVGDEIYEFRSCYKRPEVFFQLFSVLRDRAKFDTLSFPLRVFSTTKNLNCNDAHEQLLVSVLVEQFDELDDEPICRYYVFNDGWDWSHRPSRIQLKATARMIFKELHSPVPLYVVSPTVLQKISDGKLVPRNLLDRPLLTTPSIEDFALSPEESGIAEEVEELPRVLKYIEEHKLEDLFKQKPPQSYPDSEYVPEPLVTPGAVEENEATEGMSATPKRKESPRGITKGSVIGAFEGLYFDRDKWSKYLASPPKWLAECRVARGNKATSATWNPVLIASALYDRNIPIKRLDAVFVSLRDWADEWREVSETFR